MLERFLRFIGVDCARTVWDELYVDKGTLLALAVPLAAIWLLFSNQSPFQLDIAFP